jgi:hypothetical protein
MGGRRVFLGFLVLALTPAAPRVLAAQSSLALEFADSSALTTDERSRVAEVVVEVEARARMLLSELPPRVRVTVTRVARDLSTVGGVSGRADAPGELLIEISSGSPGDPASAPGLRNALFHELHHLARGWTIRDNRFGPGIAIAAVNEGLAEVFAETQTGLVLPANEYPENVSEWAREIMALPSDANYGAWMFAHPDGRHAVGYRTGRYIVHRALALSGRTVSELSQLSPAEIIELAQLER